MSVSMLWELLWARFFEMKSLHSPIHCGSQHGVSALVRLSSLRLPYSTRGNTTLKGVPREFAQRHSLAQIRLALFRIPLGGSNEQACNTSV